MLCGIDWKEARATVVQSSLTCSQVRNDDGWV